MAAPAPLHLPLLDDRAFLRAELLHRRPPEHLSSQYTSEACALGFRSRSPLLLRDDNLLLFLPPTKSPSCSRCAVLLYSPSASVRSPLADIGPCSALPAEIPRCPLITKHGVIAYKVLDGRSLFITKNNLRWEQGEPWSSNGMVYICDKTLLKPSEDQRLCSLASSESPLKLCVKLSTIANLVCIWRSRGDIEASFQVHMEASCASLFSSKLGVSSETLCKAQNDS